MWLCFTTSKSIAKINFLSAKSQRNLKVRNSKNIELKNDNELPN